MKVHNESHQRYHIQIQKAVSNYSKDILHGAGTIDRHNYSNHC